MSGNKTYQNYTEGRLHPTIQELSKFKVEDKRASVYLPAKGTPTWPRPPTMADCIPFYSLS